MVHHEAEAWVQENFTEMARPEYVDDFAWPDCERERCKETRPLAFNHTEDPEIFNIICEDCRYHLGICTLRGRLLEVLKEAKKVTDEAVDQKFYRKLHNRIHESVKTPPSFDILKRIAHELILRIGVIEKSLWEDCIIHEYDQEFEDEIGDELDHLVTLNHCVAYLRTLMK